jgi:hypothetical protein
MWARGHALSLRALRQAAAEGWAPASPGDLPHNAVLGLEDLLSGQWCSWGPTITDAGKAILARHGWPSDEG